MPDGNIPAGAPGGNTLSSLISVLAGAGFEKFAGGVSKLAQSGMDLQSLFSLPNLPLMLAGAGSKDMANSMEIAGPILKMFLPQQPQQQQGPNPNEMSAAMRMLAARLSPGMGGLVPAPPQAPPAGPIGAPGTMGPRPPMGGMGLPPLPSPGMGI